MYHTKPSGPETNKIHGKFSAQVLSFDICRSSHIFMFHLVLTYFAEYVDKQLFENVLIYNISFSYMFMECFICSISFRTSSITVAKPFYSPFSTMSYHTLIVSSETAFAEEIQF